MSSENIFELKSRRCSKDRFNHGPYEYDFSLLTVLCKTCGTMVNPVYVIDQFARHESRLQTKYRELNWVIAKAEKKNRTKCEHCEKMTRIEKK